MELVRAFALRCVLIVVWMIFAVSSSVGSVRAQEEAAANEILREIATLQSALGTIHDVERVAARTYYVASIALIAHQGAWPSERPSWDADATAFEYQVSRLSELLLPDLLDIKRRAVRADLFSGAEASVFQELLAQTEAMLKDTKEFYALLEADKHDDANEWFRNNTRASYADLIGDAYTLSNDLERRLGKAQLQLRLAK